jgi:anti-anti-sigma factor
MPDLSYGADPIAPPSGGISGWRPINDSLWIKVSRSGTPGRADVALRGEVDASCAEALTRMLADVVNADTLTLSLDVAELEFLDGAGARTLALTAADMEARGGRLRLHRPSAMVSRVLEITGLGRLLITPTRSRPPERPPNLGTVVSGDSRTRVGFLLSSSRSLEGEA